MTKDTIAKQTMITEDALARGKELVQKIRALLKKNPLPYQQVLKWDRNQPRGPKGSPTGGRWVKDVSAGLSHTPQGFQESSTIRMQASRMRGMGNANYADIMNAPTGAGFHNRPRGVDLPEIVPEPKPESKVLQHLKEGIAQSSRPLGGDGANASVIVTLEYSAIGNEWQGTEAVYKPERGENWTASFTNTDIKRYIKNRDFSLAEREAFAYEVDTLLGLGIVPETVLRTNVDETNINVNTSDDGGGDGGGYDSQELQSMYDQYKQDRLDSGEAYDNVGEEMERLYQAAREEHAEAIGHRAEEMADIWNEVVKDFPDESPYGTPEGLKEHPGLPMGSKPPFERKELLGELDPLEVLKEANVDVTAAMNSGEKKRVEEVLRKRLQEGYQTLGDVDEAAAQEDLDRDDWIQNHDRTEGSLLDKQFMSFTEWRRDQGYGSGGSGGGSGEDRNPDAPHPQGGSFQHFRSNAESYGDMSAEDGARLAVLDYLIGTMDRHGQNLMFENDRPVAIDNGYSMPATSGTDDFTFRSDGVGEWMSSRDSRNVPSDLRAQLHDAVTKTDWQALVDRHPSMNRLEREAFLSRAKNMKIALQTEEGLRELWSNLTIM